MYIYTLIKDDSYVVAIWILCNFETEYFTEEFD